jgi:peptidoglycan lytic transglycosylase
MQYRKVAPRRWPSTWVAILSSAAAALGVLGPVAPPAPAAPPAAPPDAPPPTPESATKQTGIASWYGAFHQGRRTASGEVFDMRKSTAAHRTLPLGSRVRVTNLDNGKSVVVRINDRGPMVPGRILDLSRSAADRLGAIARGLIPVRIDVVAVPGGDRSSG